MLDDFKVAADKLIDAGVKRFDMTPSLGEITLDPTWRDKIQYIDGWAEYIQIYTHGMNLTLEDLEFIASLNTPTTLFISVYGDDPETFREITGHDRFYDVMRSIRLIKGMYDRREVPAWIRFGLDIRFKEIEIPLTIHNINLRNELWRIIYSLIVNDNFLLYNKWENSNWGVAFPDLMNAKEEKQLIRACDCLNVTLNPNGDAVICDICHPYDERFEILGNIFTDEVEVIYNRLEEVADKMNEGEFPEVCWNCTEYTCVGDMEDYYDGTEWKTRPKEMW
jgi:hypothetical protein